MDPDGSSLTDQEPAEDGASGRIEHSLVEAAWAQFERLRASGDSRLGMRGGEPAAPRLRIPGYRLLGEIHRGGQGVVYQAIQESTRRKLAVKVLKQGPFADRTELARFEREVDVLSRLNHPHIVAIHDRGLTEGHAYYVMDYIAGQALDAHVAGEALSVDQMLDLFAKVCDAVNAAHLRGVIHRDLKPGNVRIDLQGEPRILDFGLAKLEQEAARGASSNGMTLTGQFVGSLPWASPEQAEGRNELLDIRTDVYSLGVMLYQLLTARFPYPVTGRAGDVVRHIAQTSPARPSSASRAIDHDLETIVLKCLAKEPDQRYQSAGELARDLRLYRADQPILATPPSTRYRLRKFVQRNRGLAIGAAAVAATLLVASAVSIVFGIREARQRKTAEAALARAETAERQARTRAKELEQVAEFQQAQLADIDPQTMGLRLRTALLDRVRVAAQHSSLTSAEVEARLTQFENLIAGSDFTGLATQALDENIFQRTLEAIQNQFSDQPLVEARLLQTLATTQYELGLYEAARAPQERALELRRNLLGVDHPDTLDSVAGMGLLIRAQGMLDQAEPYYRQALDDRRRVLGEDHPDTIRSIRNMGILLQAQGKLAEAGPFYDEALEKCRRTLGEEHPDTLTSLASVGFLLTAQGKWDQAEPYYREVLEKRRRVLGDEHPHTLFAINNMAALLQTQGDFGESEKLYAEALEKRRRVLGDDHPDTLQSINNLGNLLEAQRKYAEAEPYYREALEKRRRVLGNEHPRTLTSIANMGTLLYYMDKLTEAEPFTREALEKRRRSLGDTHPDTLTSINNMGALVKEQGRLAEAEAYYRETLAGIRLVLGDEHPNTFITIINLSSLLQSEGKHADAVELLASAEPTARRKFSGPNEPKLGRFLITLGSARAAAGQFEMAQANLAEADRILSAPGIAPHWNPSDVRHAFVTLYDAWDTADPNHGHDVEAARWRATLESEP